MKTKRILIAIGAGLILFGCATTDDPHTGGLVGGMHGLSSGAYDRRISEREDNLAKLRAIQKDLDQETVSLTSDKQQREQILEKEKGKLAAMNKDVSALEKSLADLEQEKGSQDARIADAHQRLQELKTKLAAQDKSIDDLEGSATGGADSLEGNGTGNAADLRIQQLEAQRDSLQKEYEELLNLTLMLAQ